MYISRITIYILVRYYGVVEMAWKSLGKDAVNKNTKPIQFIPREADDKLVQCRVTPAFHEKLQQYCEEHQIKMSQFVRYALSRTMNS